MNRLLSYLVITIALALTAGSSLAQTGMIASTANPRLNVNAYGGAAHGALLRIVNNCGPSIGDCTWIYRNGMIVNSARPNLAWNAYGGAYLFGEIRIVDNCSPTNPDCTWTLQNGMIISNANPNLAIHAFGAAVHGAPLMLTSYCSPENYACTWIQQIAPNQIDYTSSADFAHYRSMTTRVRLDRSSSVLQGNTRTRARWFLGFEGSVLIAFVDKDNFILHNSQPHRYGVGAMGDRTDPWAEAIPPAVATATHRVVIIHYLSPDDHLTAANLLRVGSQLDASMRTVHEVLETARN